MRPRAARAAEPESLGNISQPPTPFALVLMCDNMSRMRRIREFRTVVDERAALIARLRRPARQIGQERPEPGSRVAFVLEKVFVHLAPEISVTAF